MIHIDDAWANERERLLIAEEDAMFRAARDRATTVEERAYWNDLLKQRERNLRLLSE